MSTTRDASDLKQVIAVEVSGIEIALFRLDDGYFATSNICTHQFAFMSEGYVDDKGCIRSEASDRGRSKWNRNRPLPARRRLFRHLQHLHTPVCLHVRGICRRQGMHPI